MSNANLFRDVISKMMEAVTLDNKGNLKILDEKAMGQADELLNQMVVETARDWWAQLESAEDSLADMADEISFGELNGDRSHVGSPALAVGADEDELSAAPTLESLLKGKEFNLDSIFEMREDDEDFGPTDGDDDYDDLMTGNDDAGLGDDGPSGDYNDDGDDLDSMGTDDDGDFGGDDIGGSGDFDFSFLDDDGGDELGLDGDDEFGSDDGGFGGDDDGDFGDDFGDDDDDMSDFGGDDDDMGEGVYEDDGDADDEDEDDK